MAAGMQVGTSLGELLIDSSNIKMFLRHYGTAGASFTVPAIDPVVFVRPLESGAGGGCARSEWRCGHRNIGAREYYVFDRPVQASGLDAWNEQGVQIFTASQYPLNIIGSVNIPQYFEGNTGN